MDESSLKSNVISGSAEANPICSGCEIGPKSMPTIFPIHALRRIAMPILEPVFYLKDDLGLEELVAMRFLPLLLLCVQIAQLFGISL